MQNPLDSSSNEAFVFLDMLSVSSLPGCFSLLSSCYFADLSYNAL